MNKGNVFLAFATKVVLVIVSSRAVSTRLYSQEAIVLQAVRTAPSRAATGKTLQSPKVHIEIFYIPFPPQNVKGISQCNCVTLESTCVSNGLDL